MMHDGYDDLRSILRQMMMMLAFFALGVTVG